MFWKQVQTGHKRDLYINILTSGFLPAEIVQAQMT